MITSGCYHALAAVGGSPPRAYAGPRRGRQASVPAPLPMSPTKISRRRRSLASRAAINIPPDALVHPFRDTLRRDPQWGIEEVETKAEGKDVETKAEGKDVKVKLWVLLTGIDESKVGDEVEVDLPHGSNVLTIKKTKKVPDADDEVLDVRLLLTAGCSRDGIKVEKEKKEGGKVRLEVTIVRKITEFGTINIK